MSAMRRTGVIHVHSSYSHDGCDSLERLREFALERGIAFIGLTDHAEDFGPDRFDEYVRHCRALSDDRVSIVPGLEYRFDGFPGMHLLALGLKRWIAPQTPDEFVRDTRDAATFTIAAHPLLANYRLPEIVAQGIDAVEVWNASYNTRYLPDPRAIRLLHAIRRTRPDVVGTAGLDQHDCENDRQVRVVVDDGMSDPIAALKTGRFTNLGRTMSFSPAVKWNRARLGVLTAARWALDRVEHAQDRIARRLHAGRPKPFFEAPGGSRTARRILLISPRFPPAPDVGARRWQKLARFVAERGWEIDVIALHRDCVQLPDWSTLSDLPPGTRVYGIHPRAVRLARLIDSAWKLFRKMRSRARTRANGDMGGSAARGVRARPDSVPRTEIRWSLTEPRSYVRAYNAWTLAAEFRQETRQAFALARRIIAPDTHDVIVSSGPPHSAHEAARLVSRHSGVPFAIDMRDVWSLIQRCSEPFASPLLLHLLQRHERRVVNEASLVIVNTEPVRAAMAQAYPHASERILAVTNGFDDDPLPRAQRGSQFIIAHAGTIYMGRDPGGLFRAARRVIDELNLSPSEFALRFMGANDLGISLTEMADAEGVGAFVHVVGPSPRTQALEFLAQATMLVILPQDWDMSIPAKLFEYVRFDAWLLALAERNSATGLVLRDTDADVVSPGDITAMAAVLRTRYQQYAAGTRPRKVASDVRLSRRYQAEILLDALERRVRPTSAREHASLAAR
jgi:PHP domain